MEIVKRITIEKTYDKDGKVVSEKTTEEHFDKERPVMPILPQQPYYPPLEKLKISWLPEIWASADTKIVDEIKYGVSGVK